MFFIHDIYLSFLLGVLVNIHVGRPCDKHINQSIDQSTDQKSKRLEKFRKISNKQLAIYKINQTKSQKKSTNQSSICYLWLAESLFSLQKSSFLEPGPPAVNRSINQNSVRVWEQIDHLRWRAGLRTAQIVYHPIRSGTELRKIGPIFYLLFIVFLSLADKQSKNKR